MKHSKAGWRVRLLPGSHYSMWTGEEGVFVEKKANQPAWPYVIHMDNGNQVELDEGQFEFIGPAEPGVVQPAGQIVQQDQGKEVEVKTATKTKVVPIARVRAKRDASAAAKAARAERVPLKAPASARVPLKAREPVRREPVKGRANVVPLKGRVKVEAKADKPAAKTGKAKQPRMSWPEAIMKVMDGRKGVKLPDIYDGVKKLIGEPNNHFDATVRQCLQSLARQGKTRNPRAGVWDALKKA